MTREHGGDGITAENLTFRRYKTEIRTWYQKQQLDEHKLTISVSDVTVPW
jgi:hypothetical protein